MDGLLVTANKNKMARKTVVLGIVFCMTQYVHAITMATTQTQAITTAEPFDENCISNKSLPRTAKDNYVNCKTEKQVALNKTECCTVDGEVGCCEPGGLYKIVDIGIAIGCTTAGLMALVFLIFWCNKETFPCLEKLHKRCGCTCKCKSVCAKKTPGENQVIEVHGNDTITLRPVNGQVSPFDDGERPSTSGSGGEKGDGRSPRQHSPPDHIPIYDMPEELRVEVKEDDFWGSV